MERTRRILIINLRIAAVALMIASGWVTWRFMASLPWEVDCGIAAAAVLAFAYRFEHEMRVRIVKRPAGTCDGVLLDQYAPGECYEVSRSVGDYLVLQGYAERELPSASRRSNPHEIHAE
jgi:hypothetical protein